MKKNGLTLKKLLKAKEFFDKENSTDLVVMRLQELKLGYTFDNIVKGKVVRLKVIKIK